MDILMETDNQEREIDRSSVRVPKSRITPEKVLLCRFDSGRLFKDQMSIYDTKYITVSHVWGIARWQDVLGGEVLVSDEKAKFIIERLPLIVGAEWFWMDILCINQRDKDARIAVTQHIPKIFRCAQKTIVVKNGNGLRECCIQAIGRIDVEEEIERAVRAITDHALAHRPDNGGRIKEDVFERLWVLQEVTLSRSIQFVRCDDMGSNSDPKHTFGTPVPSIYGFLEFLLRSTAVWGWDENHHHDGTETELRLNMIRAFVNDGIVRRNQPLKSRPFPSQWELLPHQTSTRLTSHPRDFILALMPQYDFYQVPQNARRMKFGELFVDCFEQGRRAGWELAPLITGGSTSVQAAFPLTDNIPEPACLGDLVKLLLGPKPILTGSRFRSEVTQVERVHDRMDPTVTIQLISDCLNISPSTRVALGDLWLVVEKYQHLLWEDSGNRSIAETARLNFTLAALVMQTIIGNYDEPSTRKRMVDFIEPLPELMLPLIQLAAVISCGLGASAYFWSLENQTPVIVRIQGQCVLGLVPKSMADGVDGEFYLIEVEPIPPATKRWALAIMKGGSQHPSSCIVGLLPPSVRLD
jgi:hypothetical protein